MKLNNFAFISSPYAAILRSESDEDKARDIIIQIARFGSKLALQDGFVPFSPVLAFEGIYTEAQRDEIMQKCFEAISNSSVFYCVKTEYFSKSLGMQAERNLAVKINIPVIDIDCLEQNAIIQKIR